VNLGSGTRLLELKEWEEMRVIGIAIVLALLSIEGHAQQNGPTSDQCDQVRAAITQYGLQAARKHAMENYSLSQVDVRTIEQNCGIADRGRAARRTKR
jgi:hypothetical protein